jgi:aspartate carbamoyltransferase catalytic subunit
MEFKGRDVISINDFSTKEIEHILKLAEEMVSIARGEKSSNLLDGKILSTVFFEPSTRTRLSFESAMHRLGGKVMDFGDIKKTSVKKGETLADTIRMMEAYSDVIVLRHSSEGAARLASEFSEKPVLNGGDGSGQHPTQTLLDMFTIKNKVGKIKGKNVVFVGDLKYGRTVHSLALALSKFGAKLTFVAPPSLEMPKEIIDTLKGEGTSIAMSQDLQKALKNADVLYVTRIQKERFPDPEEYGKVASIYKISNNNLEDVKKKLIIMHPLPRVNEIAPEVDATDHAVYFEQAFNGVPVRMALLALVLGKRR